MKKNSIFIACWLIAFGIGCYVRLYPLIKQASADAHDKATMTVLARLKLETESRVRADFPQLTELQKKQAAKETFDRLLSNESVKVKKSINELARQIDASRPHPAAPYLLASDSYYYLGLTQNIIETGAISKTIKGGQYFYPATLAPEGHWKPMNLHPYVGYGTYRILRLIRPDIELVYAISFVAIIITGLALIPYLGICRILACQAIPSLIGAVFFVLAPIFVKRSAFGWYDNDPYNVLFPLAILFFFFTGLRRITSYKNSAIFGFICAALFALYSFFWHGWVFLFGIIGLSLLLNAAYFRFIARQRKSGYLAVYGALICFATFALISLASFGIQDFFAFFTDGWDAIQSFLQPKFSAWPDNFISVGELKSISIGKLIELCGGVVFFIIALGGVGAAGYRIWTQPDKRHDASLYMTLGTLLAASLVIAVGALRFALLALIPLSIFFAVGVQYLYALTQRSIARYISRQNSRQIAWATVVVAVSALIIFVPLRHAHRTMTQFRPIFNDAWQRALTAIKEQTPQNSIINTWWPPGYFISTVAQRRVTFDGGTINAPQAYWMAKVFLSDDERRAAGILRMLNNSANKATEFLQAQNLRLPLAIEKLTEIATDDKKTAAAALSGTLSDDQIEHLLTLTHATPPPSYVLIYTELVDKNLQLSFIGQWDFEKVAALIEDPEARKTMPRANTKEYIKFLWDLGGGPLKYSETIPLMSRDGDRLFFRHNIVIRLSDMTCRIDSKKFGRGIPHSIVYRDGDTVIEKPLSDSNLNYTVLLSKDRGTFHCILLDPRLARSLLIRLYFFEGKGLRYFKPLLQETDLTGRTRIVVYQIDWERLQNDAADD